MRNDYCDSNSTKRAKKKEEILMTMHPQDLQLLNDDPLLGMPIWCRFDHPMDLNNIGARAQIIENAIINNDGCTLTHEIKIKKLRKDRWLVSHPRFLFESWQANADFQLVVDKKSIAMLN